MSEFDGWWDQEAEHQIADFVHLLNRLAADAEEHAIGVAEEALKEAVDYPAPDTAHPACEGQADFVRRFDGDHVALPIIRRSAYFAAEPSPYATADVSNDRVTLTRRRMRAPAPAVWRYPGQGAFYFWDVWTDPMGRYVAGSAVLLMEPVIG